MKRKKMGFNPARDKSVSHKIKLGHVRAEQLKQGFFDGRFIERVGEDKSMYSRKFKNEKSMWQSIG